MRSSRFIVFTLALALLTLTAAGAFACDKKGAAAASTKAACCQKGAAKTASAACPSSAAADCTGKTAAGTAMSMTIESERVSANELVVDYVGTDAKSVAELTKAAGAPLPEFSCPLVREMVQNEECQVEMEATERGVRFTASSDDVALLDGFAQNYKQVMSAPAPAASKRNAQEGQEKQGI